jgi:hypothetical protein
MVLLDQGISEFADRAGCRHAARYRQNEGGLLSYPSEIDIAKEDQANEIGDEGDEQQVAERFGHAPGQ